MALVIGIAVLAEAARVLFGGNVHTVIPGRVYRSAQLSPNSLRALIQKRGIRTVVNLRGCCNPFDWYLDECRLTHEMNVSQEDVTLSANRLPPPSELRQLVDVLDRAEYPIVLHCRQGADRTGLAATISMLLHTNADIDEARRQCSPRYAHFAVLSTANMDLFFDMYEAWLAQKRRSHSPDLFRSWVLNDYRPDPAPARIEFLGKLEPIPMDTSITLPIRLTNLSNTVWQFKTGSFTGIHVRAIVEDRNCKVVAIPQAGHFEATVAPGESIALTLALPPFHEEGPHRVIIDVVDRHINFCQLGNDRLELEIQVEKQPGR